MFKFFKSKEEKTALSFFQKRQKILNDFMTLKNKVSPSILAVQVAKNTGIIVTTLDHSVPFGTDAPTMSEYRKKIIASLHTVCKHESNKYTKNYTHTVNKMNNIENSEELSKRTVTAINKIVSEQYRKYGSKLDEIYSQMESAEGEANPFSYSVLSYMSDEQFAIRMSGLFVCFPYGKNVTLHDIYLGLCSYEKFEDYKLLFMNR